MEIDRALLREILQKMADVRPNQLEVQQVYPGRDDVTNAIQYLADHGLAEAQFRGVTGPVPQYILARATARGIDYLTQDGGLSAELDVVTFKLHPETLASLIEATPAFQALSNQDRTRLSSRLRGLGSKALESLVKELVGQAVARSPDALQWLQTTLARLQ